MGSTEWIPRPLPTAGQQCNQAEREEEDRHQDSPARQESMLKYGRVATLSHHRIAVCTSTGMTRSNTCAPTAFESAYFRLLIKD
jgi:hypothetical protein